VARVRWKLATYLQERGITPYRLAKAVAPEARTGTVYRLARAGREPSRIDLPTLATVLEGLRRVTGEAVSFEDVLEFEPSPAADRESLDPETSAWLDSELTEPLPPYDWGDVDPLGIGEAVKYVPAEGLTVRNDGAGKRD
jgi:hypothetical protein